MITEYEIRNKTLFNKSSGVPPEGNIYSCLCDTCFQSSLPLALGHCLGSLPKRA